MSGTAQGRPVEAMGATTDRGSVRFREILRSRHMTASGRTAPLGKGLSQRQEGPAEPSIRIPLRLACAESSLALRLPLYTGSMRRERGRYRVTVTSPVR